MTDPIRIGIVGAGRIVRAEHAPRFQAIDGVALVGVANRSPESSRRAADELGLSRAYADWHELIDDPAIDAVLVGAWPVLHAPVTIAALDAGKHVLTEARMAATAEDARAMLRAARARPDLTSMVVPASFSFWADATIIRLLGNGAIGPLRHVHARWDASGPGDPGDFWRLQRVTSGENVMALGILAEAMARWLGHAESVTALTRLDSPVRRGPSGPIEADVPDHVLALVEYPNDVTAVVEMSGRTNGLESDRVTFHGADGSLIADLGSRRLELVPRGKTSGDAVAIPDEDRAEWTAEVDFVAAIRGERAVTQTDFATGVGYMAFLEAVQRSAASGRRTAIEGVSS
ncbi:MAG: Gfo/Idh/MocA family oxidoreductase [Chloroflexi bacterium]|nr:Gfo/Idh/MocA family oxidoreductase [Chloroflexota bacterium]